MTTEIAGREVWTMRESCVNGARDQCGGAISLLRISNALLLVVGCNDLIFEVAALVIDFLWEAALGDRGRGMWRCVKFF
jgi:hypothetical protein